MKFFTILLIEILAGAEVDLFTPSFPELQRIFQLSPFMVQLTLSVNFLAYCIGATAAGILGDKYSRRIVILWGLFIFIIGSLLCIVADHYSVLLLGRFLQGLGIAGPAVLAYVVIADEYEISKQQQMMGIISGIITFAMAFAPVVGSYVNLYFNWRGNFVCLGVLGLASFIFSYLYIPHNKTNPTELAPLSYISLFKSPKLLTYSMAICFFIIPYMIFIGMAPILYMDDLGVDLKSFGLYQGANALVFSIVSISSGRILQKWGQERCFYVGVGMSMVGTIMIICVALIGSNDPIVITSSLLLFSAGIVIPINILYPLSLEVVENAKGRIAAIIMAMRLILTAIGLQTVSYYYTGSFFTIAMAMLIATIIAMINIAILLRSKWINFIIEDIN